MSRQQVFRHRVSLICPFYMNYLRNKNFIADARLGSKYYSTLKPTPLINNWHFSPEILSKIIMKLFLTTLAEKLLKMLRKSIRNKA